MVVVTVTVAVRTSSAVLAAAVRAIDPLFVPVAGETVNQVWSEDTFHAAFEVTATVVFAAADDVRGHVVLSKDSVTGAPGWVTVTVAVCAGVPVVVVNVSVA